jgi:hypothetical protein
MWPDRNKILRVFAAHACLPKRPPVLSQVRSAPRESLLHGPIVEEARMLDQRPNDTVLLIAGSSPQRHRLAAALQRRGYHATLVETPLDAIVQLVAPTTTIRVALVAEQLATARGEQVMRSLAEDVPGVAWLLLVETAPVDRVNGLWASSWRVDDVAVALRRLGLSWPAAG